MSRPVYRSLKNKTLNYEKKKEIRILLYLASLSILVSCFLVSFFNLSLEECFCNLIFTFVNMKFIIMLMRDFNETKTFSMFTYLFLENIGVLIVSILNMIDINKVYHFINVITLKEGEYINIFEKICIILMQYALDSICVSIFIFLSLEFIYYVILCVFNYLKYN